VPFGPPFPWGAGVKYLGLALLIFLAFTLAATFPGVAYRMLAMMGVGNG